VCFPQFVDLVCALEPTFGGINLEDIKAPECFYGRPLPFYAEFALYYFRQWKFAFSHAFGGHGNERKLTVAGACDGAVEKECQRRCSIPVFHDDQHGTAIIAGAGLLNALDLVVKEISQVNALPFLTSAARTLVCLCVRVCVCVCVCMCPFVLRPAWIILCVSFNVYGHWGCPIC
jgi:malate dehydrogenase (oxaloacetate-decarboxylating)(NADP+)